MSNIPTAAPDPMQDFQDKLRQRVRDDIRALLPEEAVGALVQRAVEDEFFKPRHVQDGYRTQEVASWFVEEVAKAAKPIIESAVAKAIADHPDAIEKAIAEFLNKDRLAVAATSHLSGMLASAIFQMEQRLSQLR